jgi:HAD superfamily hydrolase (TIGR01450 family)
MTSPAQSLSEIRHVVLDLDGTLYLDGVLFPCTLPFLEELGRLQIGYSFMTNNNSRSHAEYVALLDSRGIATGPGQIVTSTDASVSLLRRRWPRATRLSVLGTPGCRGDFAAAGFTIVDGADEPDAVIVAFDTTLAYERLAATASWIARGKPYLATHPDLICPTKEETVLPDCGSICALLESATGRKPDAIAGKPSPELLHHVARQAGHEISKMAVVGDRLYTDMKMARDAGAVSVLVLSGETTREQADAANPKPDFVVADVGDFGRRIAHSQPVF